MTVTPYSKVLHMNRPAIVRLRRYWAALDLHPPD